MLFNEEYYKNNRQDSDRIGLLFYSNLIKNYFKPNTILDYGCGTGYFLKRLSKIKTIKKTYGFEVSEYAINKAKNNSKKSILIKNLAKLDDHYIDIITALHVIEHINDNALKKIILSFKRILKNNGVIILATPAKNGFAHKIKKEKWIGFSDKTHINLKTFEEWKSFFNSNNLVLFKSSNDGLWDFPYRTKNNKFAMLYIFFKMIIQIITGKLYLSYNKGETFVFFLKFR